MAVHPHNWFTKVNMDETSQITTALSSVRWEARWTRHAAAFHINSGSARLVREPTPTVGLWHSPVSHTASLIPLIFTAQKQKCLSDVQPWGGWERLVREWRGTPQSPLYCTCGVPQSQHMMQDWLGQSDFTWKSTELQVDFCTFLKKIML